MPIIVCMDGEILSSHYQCCCNFIVQRGRCFVTIATVIAAVLATCIIIVLAIFFADTIQLKSTLFISVLPITAPIFHSHMYTYPPVILYANFQSIT